MNEDLLMKRLFAKVDKNGPIPEHKPELGPCWVWLGCCIGGYGNIAVNGKSMRTHRLSYELANGPIPPGFEVRHDCHFRPCLNPKHLLLGTRADNMRDMMQAGRWKHGPVDPEIQGELTRRKWASYTPRERLERVYKVSIALKDKPLTEEHLANLRASPANQKGRAPRAYGAQLPQTALTPEQVLAIREKYALGIKQEEIAKEFGIVRAAISNIVRGVSYKWIDGSGPVKRQSGYGTKIKSDHSIHANTGRRRTPEQKAAHAERMRQRWTEATPEQRERWTDAQLRARGLK